MTDWEQVATASGYKNVTNAKTMFSRLCKKLEKSNSDGQYRSDLLLQGSTIHIVAGTESPSGGVSKASTTQGKTKAGPKKAVKRAKAVKEEYDDELDDTGVMEEDDEETEI